MQDFKKLKVWEKSHQLTLNVYQETTGFPKEEVYGLTSQIRRACASVPANIAEGCGRDSPADQARFFQIALGSASEVEYFIILAHDLGYFPDRTCEDLLEQVIEVKRMLAGLIKRVRQKG